MMPAEPDPLLRDSQTDAGPGRVNGKAFDPQRDAKDASLGPYGDQAIEAAFLHTKSGFYFIGPFSRRVSFASQQCRAIDLVNALHSKNKLKGERGPCKVAVVGGGIAGLTAAAVLRGHGCVVDVFERADSVLHLQRAARHRVIHPTIARWPRTRPLKYSTNFGVLDWCAGPGDSVLATMREEWEWRRGFVELEHEGHPAFTNAKVRKLIGSSKNSPYVSIINEADKENPAEEANRKTYDLAIVATGFGKESVPQGLDAIAVPYWTKDQIDDWRKSGKQVYVSGCGDGGLIDCLRLVHGDFQDGWLTIRLAQFLESLVPGEWLDKMEEVEHEALLITKSIECMGIANPGEKKDSPRRSDQIYEKLSEFYGSFVRDMPSAAIDLLKESIRRAEVNVGKVVLCAQEAAPFTPRSAPIHKIMLAHAMQGNFVEFRPGRLYAEKPSKRPRKRDTGSTCVPLFEFDGSDTVRAGGEAVVIRHGPGLPFEDLEIERQEVASLRLRQIMLADFLDLERAGPKPWPDRWTRQKERGMDYLAAKWFAARALMQVIRPGCEVGFNKSGFTYEPFPAAEAKKNGALPSLERPDELFGMRVKRRAIDETDAL